MIGRLPKTLKIGGIEREINADFRSCLCILQAYSDEELTGAEKTLVMLKRLYKDEVPAENVAEAVIRGIWFLNCGEESKEEERKKPILYDWEQDEQLIFSAVNKVAGREVRECDFMHFWTFIGLFNEVGEGTFSTIVSIRNKRASGKKLEDWEQEYYAKHRDIVDIRKEVRRKRAMFEEARRLYGGIRKE